LNMGTSTSWNTEGQRCLSVTIAPSKVSYRIASLKANSRVPGHSPAMPCR
jgi:hypothetical protein